MEEEPEHCFVDKLRDIGSALSEAQDSDKTDAILTNLKNFAAGEIESTPEARVAPDLKQGGNLQSESVVEFPAEGTALREAASLPEETARTPDPDLFSVKQSSEILNQNDLPEVSSNVCRNEEPSRIMFDGELQKPLAPYNIAMLEQATGKKSLFLESRLPVEGEDFERSESSLTEVTELPTTGDGTVSEQETPEAKSSPKEKVVEQLTEMPDSATENLSNTAATDNDGPLAYAQKVHSDLTEAPASGMALDAKPVEPVSEETDPTPHGGNGGDAAANEAGRSTNELKHPGKRKFYAFESRSEEQELGPDGRERKPQKRDHENAEHDKQNEMENGIDPDAEKAVDAEEEKVKAESEE
ncbi:unnamed protein product, partial [Dibothriocephalus latus]